MTEGDEEKKGVELPPSRAEQKREWRKGVIRGEITTKDKIEIDPRNTPKRTRC